MKTLMLSAFALTIAASVFAQGTIYLGNRFTSAPANISHVYAPLPFYDREELTGNSTNDLPVGTTDYGSRALIGANGLSGQFGAATTLAQYVAAVGANQPMWALQPVGQVTSFRSGSGAGFLAQITSTVQGPGFGAGAVGPFTFSIVAWDNSSGLYPTWDQAWPAAVTGLLAVGMMKPFTIERLGGGTEPPVSPNQVGGVLTSFNLNYAIPEPACLALVGVIGAMRLIFRQRR